MTNGWDESAEAWIRDMGTDGDYSRRHVLDAPMLARVAAGTYGNALDLGCGEGRFCRMLAAAGISSIGIDPTEGLIAQAKAKHPDGDYRVGRAESLDFPDDSFDLVVSYMTFVDIADIASAIAEIARVLRPGGSLLIANLNSFNSAGRWVQHKGERRKFEIDRYLEERASWQSWRGIRIKNWHRPLSTYMTLLLGAGLQLRHFAEPAPTSGDAITAEQYRRVPYFLIMEWQKPANIEARDSNTTIVHENPWFSVSHRTDANTLGNAGWFRVVRPDGVVIVPTLLDGSVVMLKGTRDTTGSDQRFELPAGAIDLGESAEGAALRELHEETGFTAQTLVKIGEFVEAPGISAARCLVFAAQVEHRTAQSLEPGEDWTPTICTPEEITKLQASGLIVDGSTLAALRLWELWAASDRA